DFELDDENEDLIEAIESVLTLRKRSGHVVRLEVDTSMTDDIRDLLVRELKLEPWLPQAQAVLTRTDPPADLFRLLQSGEVLVHHPYASFATSVAEFV